MGKVFDKYAKYYDMLYTDKDYEKECDFIEEIFRQYGESKPHSILDVGCGTGGHLVPLTKRGYDTVGIDISDGMLRVAMSKIRRMRINAKLYNLDVKSFSLNQQFDAVICMFAVIGYLIENEDLSKAFNNVRNHISPKGLFICDFWYGPAVLTIRPSVKAKRIIDRGLTVIETITPEVDLFKHISTSKYHIIVLKGNKVIDEIRESHTVRFLFPQEIKHYLEENSFKVVRISEFLKLDRLPTEKTWNAVVIARAI